MEAQTVVARVKDALENNKRVPRRRRVQTLAEFSEQSFVWLDSLPTARPLIEATKKYYRTGCRLVQATKLAGMRIDQITEDDVRATAVGSSPANTNNDAS